MDEIGLPDNGCIKFCGRATPVRLTGIQRTTSDDPTQRLTQPERRTFDDKGGHRVPLDQALYELALSTRAPARAKGSVDRHGGRVIGHEISRKTCVCR